MQSFKDAGMDNWHDFEVESRMEIVALLRSIGEKGPLIRMLIPGGQDDICVTSILHVDPGSNAIILDCSVDQEQNRRIVGAKRVSFETSLDKIRILFDAGAVSGTVFKNNPALRIEIPETMIRLQRREFYRMVTPLRNPVCVLIPMPEHMGGGSHIFPLADISCGGIAILDNKHLLGNTIGNTYAGCRLDLLDSGSVTTALQIRNTLDMTLLNSKSTRRLGCQFIDISRGNSANVQRYITRLEREHNARIAGLG